MNSLKTPEGLASAPARTPLWATGRAVATVAALLLLTSVVLNIALARKVHLLVYERAREAAALVLQPGELVPRIPGKLVGTGVDTFRFERDNRPTVLYYFSPTCGWCARNLDNLKTLLQLKSGEYRFIGLSLAREDSVQVYLAENDLALPTYTDVPQDVLEAYRLQGTPETIVVSPESRVLQNWPGAYVEEQAAQVAAFFHVVLPGLRPVEPHP